ncbi:MAG: hypothetical protein K9H26_10855 [Prolixibacteraceae bacterium]|nr:hypothetical protein [Prolixibacteraceae bacterium]
MIPELTIQKIKDTARIEDFVKNPKKAYGNDKMFTECPNCGFINEKKKNGLYIFEKKQSAKCYKCGFYASNPIDFIMQTENLSYPEALKEIAKNYAIIIDEVEKPQPAKKQEKKQPKKPKNSNGPGPARPNGHQISFCDQQLKESGILYDDIRIETRDENGTKRYISPFVQGTRDQYGNILEQKGDDILIKYFDLEGKPVMYRPETARAKKKELKGNPVMYRPETSRIKMKELIRVRWKNPSSHLDKNDEPIKYQSPAGSGSHVYIPERLRQAYKQHRKLKRLYIQEGEKKAEKSCKHGMYSLGIMGINNLASNGRLPDEIQLIVERCEVEETVFVLDADWNQLSTKLENGKAVDTRPKQFFFAVKNYKEYLRTLANLGNPVEIFFAHINYNSETKEKGIDDLLTGTLRGKETELINDFDFATNEKNGAGQYVTVHKITMLPDSQIADFWLLNDSQEFSRIHKKRLEKLKEFKIKNLLRRFDENGKLELAQKLLPDEQFWDIDTHETRSGEKKKNISFNYVKAMTFLQNRGFFRYKMKSGEKVLISIENRVISEIDHTDVKDFVKEFCREIKEIDVLNMLMRGGPQYLGPEKLSNLDLTFPKIERATADKQHLFFQDKIWEITADGIKELNYAQFGGHVWSEKKINHNVELLPPMLSVTVMSDEIREKVSPEYKRIPNGEFFIDYSDDAKNCHYLQFLINTSNFHWKKDKGIEKEPVTVNDLFLTSRHLINKLTAFGYLLHDYKNDSERKMVVGMDGKLSEVGSSNGRSGKSLHGKAIAQLIPQVYIDGKMKQIDDDKFRYHDVTEKTKNVFFDDVRVNFDVESLFAVITGQMTVNQKSGLRFNLSEEDTPKIYLTTNHALNGMGTSFADREAFIVFSDFYNDEHKPANDFGNHFFSEWGKEQYNLFYNLAALSLQLYFKSKAEGWTGLKNTGIVPPPMEDVQRRKLRQTMGENFLMWAESFFDWDKEMHRGNLNQSHVRKELYDSFIEEFPQESKFTNQVRFREKMLAYCKYAHFDFNPHKPDKNGTLYPDFKRDHPKKVFIGTADKTGGKEYWTIANEDYTENF